MSVAERWAVVVVAGLLVFTGLAEDEIPPQTAPIEAEAVELEELALPDEPLPMLMDSDLPKRVAPIIELGAPLLDSGRIASGIVLPTGAVWNPALWVFGTMRSGVDYRSGDERISEIEWANRLDLFANLQLSGTERLVVGVRPLDRDGRFSGYRDDEWHSEANLELGTVFFEGDFGEIFPRLDSSDRHGLDLGFAIGRQQIEFQDGIMVDDRLDSFGLTRNSQAFSGVSNLRSTLLFAWGDIDRGVGGQVDGSELVGVFNELDLRSSTVEVDFLWKSSSADLGSGLFWGIGATQRLGRINSTFRLNGSQASSDDSAVLADGLLFTTELSTSPRGRHDLVYCNGFLAIDSYTSAARDPGSGSAVGMTGILFAGKGLGSSAPALPGSLVDAWGLAIGYQYFWDHEKSQLILELGGRYGDAIDGDAEALGLRLQRKLGRQFLLQVDAFVTNPDLGDTVVGLGTEILVRF